IAFDRGTEAVADYTDPVRRHLTDALRRRLRLLTVATFSAIAIVLALAHGFGASEGYGCRTAQDWLVARVQSVLDYVQNPSSFVFGITEPIGNFLIEHVLLPLQDFLVGTPWLATVAGLTAIA